MILVTRRNGTQLFVNAELIQFVEGTPDTVLTLVDKTKLVVREPVQVVVQRLIEYRQMIHQSNWLAGAGSSPVIPDKNKGDEA